ILSGSSDEESYLMLVRLDDKRRAVSATRKTLLPKPYKHAGGIQIAGRFLAVGIEDNEKKDTSIVWILDIDQLKEETIKPFIEIKREGPVKRSTAGAVGLAKMGEKHLLAVGSWDSATIDFYESNNRPLEADDCQFTLVHSWDAADADRSKWFDPKLPSYQNINLIVDDHGAIQLIGFANTGGKNHADVFLVDLSTHRLVKKTSHVFKCQDTSFQSGAGMHGHTKVISCAGREWAIEGFGK
ncbi:MAG: hypothetical protein ACKVHP_15785, partial [Verrucomicrobiales bacterium]